MTIGYLAIAVWQHADGNVSDQTIAFEESAEAARSVGQKFIDENTLPEHTSVLKELVVERVREIRYSETLDYESDDVVFSDLREGAFVRADAKPIQE